MGFCTKCDEKLYESSQYCTKCGTRVAKDNKNMSSTPKSRMEKNHSTNKRLIAVVGSIIGLLLVIGVMFYMVKGFHKPEPTANASAAKTITQTKAKAPENKPVSSTNPTKEKKNGSSTLTSSDYLLSASNQRVMGDQDLANLTKDQLRLARNEIYARHGYIFKSKDLQKYFSSKSWYHPNQSYDGSLNEVEKQNVAILKAKEDSL